MKKWRSLFAVTAIAAMVFAMAACGDKETDVDPTEAPVTEAPADPTEAPAEPTEAPTEPTEAPAEPTEAPAEPTEVPVVEPTEEPVVEPTEEPVVEPTEEPVVEPTEAPVVEPTEAPAEPTVAPTEAPAEPTAAPTEAPEATPEPTATPAPTATPEPTATPVPTEAPAAAEATYKAGDSWYWEAWGQGTPESNPAKADGSVSWTLKNQYEQIVFTLPTEEGIDISDFSQAVVTFSSSSPVNVKLFPDSPVISSNENGDTWEEAIRLVNSNETVIIDLKSEISAAYEGRSDYKVTKISFEWPEAPTNVDVTFYSVTFK